MVFTFVFALLLSAILVVWPHLVFGRDNNVVSQCQIELRDDSISRTIPIPAGFPGVELNDGAYCDGNRLSIYKEFEVSDKSKWILSVYADQDRNSKTHLIHSIYEKGTPEPHQVAVILSEKPCSVLKNKTGIIVASLKTRNGNNIELRLTCKN